VERIKAAVAAHLAPLTVRVRNALVPPGVVSLKSGDRPPRAELERQVVEGLVRQIVERRDDAPAWTRLILEVKNMAVEGDVPASIADHVRAFLRGDRAPAVEPAEQMSVEPAAPPAGKRRAEPSVTEADHNDFAPSVTIAAAKEAAQTLSAVSREVQPSFLDAMAPVEQFEDW
jgi:hypothetical protein